MKANTWVGPMRYIGYLWPDLRDVQLRIQLPPNASGTVEVRNPYEPRKSYLVGRCWFVPWEDSAQ